MSAPARPAKMELIVSVISVLLSLPFEYRNFSLLPFLLSTVHRFSETMKCGTSDAVDFEISFCFFRLELGVFSVRVCGSEVEPSA